jgi:hypothetical protein
MFKPSFVAVEVSVAFIALHKLSSLISELGEKFLYFSSL